MFTSYQPYLEKNNRYRSYIPSGDDLMKNIVWEVYEVDDFDVNKKIALPDVCADVMTFYTSSNAYSYFMGGSITLQHMNKLDFFDDIRSIFGVRLHTGRIGNLFKYGVKDIGNERIPLSDVLSNGNELTEKIKEASDFTLRWEVFSDYLSSRMHEDYQTNDIVNYVVKAVTESRGRASICDLEDRTGYSGRYLRKIVRDFLGISIKQFSEVTKFQWMCNFYRINNGNVTLPDLALQAGYYDQSHMNLSCRKLTGALPRQIIDMYN